MTINRVILNYIQLSFSFFDRVLCRSVRRVLQFQKPWTKIVSVSDFKKLTYISNAFFCKGRVLDIGDGSDSGGHLLALLSSNALCTAVSEKLRLKNFSKKKIKTHLKSFLLPTSTMGTFGQKCFTSGTHFSGIFCNESGESIEKHINITSVSGYDNGRSRS